MDHNKAKLGADSLACFFNQFEKDPIAAVFLEVFLEELMNAKIVRLLSQPEQEGNQVNHGPQGGINSDLSPDRPQIPEAPGDLGESNPTDH